MSAAPTELAVVIARMKWEILRDIRAGLVPPTVNSFSQLHDHVDANGYGGAFEDTAHDVSDVDFWNVAQGVIDRWLRLGRRP